MPKDVIIPALGESIASGILSSWKVPEGSFVEIDQPIYELETDKITQEGLAETAGVISFLAQEGEEVEIGSTIAQIDESADKPVGSDSKVTEPSDDPLPSPPKCQKWNRHQLRKVRPLSFHSNSKTIPSIHPQCESY